MTCSTVGMAKCHCNQRWGTEEERRPQIADALSLCSLLYSFGLICLEANFSGFLQFCGHHLTPQPPFSGRLHICISHMTVGLMCLLWLSNSQVRLGVEQVLPGCVVNRNAFWVLCLPSLHYVSDHLGLSTAVGFAGSCFLLSSQTGIPLFPFYSTNLNSSCP